MTSNSLPHNKSSCHTNCNVCKPSKHAIVGCLTCSKEAAQHVMDAAQHVMDAAPRDSPDALKEDMESIFSGIQQEFQNSMMLCERVLGKLGEYISNLGSEVHALYCNLY